MKREIGLPTLVGLSLVPVVAFVVWVRGGFDFLRPHPCTPHAQGALCVQVFSDHMTAVNQVIVYVPAADPSLAGKTWRLVLTAGGSEYHGPPGQTSPLNTCDDVNGNPDSTSNLCRPEVEYVRQDSFPGFNPNSLTSGTELCFAVQVQTARTWRTLKTPPSSCARVS